MLKKFIIGFMFITITQNIFNQDLMKYNITKIKKVKVGKNSGEIGFNFSAQMTGGAAGPLTFFVNKNKIFVPDIRNKRINVYDLEINFIKTIIEEKNKMSHYADKILVDDQENIVSVTYNGLKKIDYEGKSIFYFPGNKMPKEIINSYNFFLIDNQILFKNDNKEILAIDETGIIKTKDRTLQIIQNIEKKENSDLNLLTTRNKNLQMKKEKIDALKALKEKSGNIMIGDLFFSNHVYEMKKYFEEAKKIIPKETRKLLAILVKNSALGNNEEKVQLIDLDLSKLIDPEIMGYDEDHNIYWKAGIAGNNKWTMNQAIIVFSKFGDILDMFQYGQIYEGEPNYELLECSNAKIAIASNGDIFFMKSSPSGYTFYKVTRQW